MISTARLVLRVARPDDLVPLHEIYRLPAAMQFMAGPAHRSLFETYNQWNALTRGPTPTQFDFIIEYQGRCVGKAGLWRKAELGYILHPDVWGLGLASEAVAAVLPAAFDHFRDIDAITAELDPRNQPSIRLLERHGFVHQDTARGNFLYGGYLATDTGYFALSRP